MTPELALGFVAALAVGGYVIAAAIIRWAERKPRFEIDLIKRGQVCPWPMDDVRPSQLLKFPPHVKRDSE